jgi:hypothetical protein
MRVADLLSAGKQLLAIDKADYSTYTVPGEGKMIDGVSYFVPYTDDLKTLALEVFGGENQ